MLQPTDVTAVLRMFVDGEGEVYDLYGDADNGGMKEVQVWVDHDGKRVLWKVHLEYMPNFDITKVGNARRLDGDGDENRTEDNQWVSAYGIAPWDLMTEVQKLAIKERVFEDYTEAL